MKTKFKLLLTAIFGSVAATTSVFGQTTYTWIGTNGGDDPTNMCLPNNWTTNDPLNDIPAVTLPSGAGNGVVGDTAQWDNQSLPSGGQVDCTYTNGWPSTGFGTFGVTFVLTANQTANVDIHPQGGSAGTGNIGYFGSTTSPGSGSLLLGDTSGNANILNLVFRPGTAGTIHDFLNNSANPDYIYPNVRWQSGGGVLHILDIDGTGNWFITNNLANANSSGIEIEKSGTGTMYWNGPSVSGAAPNAPINSPFTINAGTVVIQWNLNSALTPDTIVNEGYLVYDASATAMNLNGAISGAGTNEVDAGTLTVEGASTYSGNTILNGGELILDGPEATPVGTSGPLGEPGGGQPALITFAGGTLGFTVNNVYDYSPRFDPSPGQQYSFDTGGQDVTFTNNLVNGGTTTLAKLNSGTLTLAGANTYSGPTTVAAGKLQIQGSASTGNITVDNGAALGVFEGGAQIQPTVLTVGTTAGATLEFNNVSSTTTPPLVAGSISAGGPITVNVNSGTFNTIGEVFPLFKWTTGSAPPVTLGTVTGAAGTLSTNGNVIELTLTQTPFIWTGNNNGNWDLSTANNWKQSDVSAIYANGITLFDDTAPGTTSVTINGVEVQPTSLNIDNSSLTYTITSSSTGYIGGSGGLTKSGTETATLTGGNNQYTGVTTISGGILAVSALANGGSPSDIGAAANSAANLVLNGGTLQYTGTGSTSDHLLTLGTSGGTIDDEGSGGLTLNNGGAAAYSGAGARTLTLTGSDVSANDTLATVLADNGGPTAITKLGAGTWILTGLSANSGTISISVGTLQVGNGGNSAIGSGNIVDDANLDFDTANTTVNGTVTGNGSVTNSGTGTAILPGNNTYQGDTYITAGALQIGNGGATGQINPGAGANIVDNGTLIFDSTGTMADSQNIIAGTGNLIVEGTGGLFGMYGNPPGGEGAAGAYTGWTLIAAGATYEPSKGNAGVLDSSVVTNNGELLLVRQDTGEFIYLGNIVGTGEVVKGDNNTDVGDVTLVGTNTYTGGTFINGGNVVLGNNSTVGGGSIVGSVVMAYDAVNEINSTLMFNRPDNFLFTNTIIGLGNLEQEGSGTVTITGNNTFTNGITTIEASTILQVGNGAAAGTISVDDVTDDGTLVYDRSDNYNAVNLISGTGIVIQDGSGTLNLSATNYYTGATVVSNGTLIVSGQSSPNGSGVSTPNGASVGSDLDLSGSTLATTLVSGGSGVVFSNDVAGNLNINGGSLAITLNKSLSPGLSNTLYVVSGAINNNSSAGTPAQLVVGNAGPPIKNGDNFTIFNQAVVAQGGAPAITVSSPTILGVTWSFNAANGTITASGNQNTTGAKITQSSVSGGNLTFSATGGTDNGTYILVETTNLLGNIVWTPIYTNTFSATGTVVNQVVPVTPGLKAQFFNLSQP